MSVSAPDRHSTDSLSVRHLLLSYRTIFIVTVVVALAVSIFAFTQGDVYRSSATIAPVADFTGRGGPAGLGSLTAVADQFGFSIDSGVNDPTSMVPILLSSRRLLDKVVDRRFAIADGDSTSLWQGLGRSEPMDYARDRAVLRETLVEEVLGHRYLRKSGATVVWADTPDPVLSAGLVNFVIEELERLNGEIRSAAASDRLSFIQGRLVEAKESLARAEEELRRFRDQNREVAASPGLAMEEARLVRDVRVREEVFLTLTTQMELARIEKEKNTPVLVVVDPAMPAVDPHGPKRVLLVLTWTLAGLVALLAFRWLPALLPDNDRRGS